MTQDRLNTITVKMNETLPIPVTSEFVGKLIIELSKEGNKPDSFHSYFETQDENIVAAYLAMMLTYYQN